MRHFYLILLLILSANINAQETITVQTLTYDSTGRDYMFDFPADDGASYESIIMEYSMRCKGAQVSVPGNTNLGCGEWDYSCNTFLIDTSRMDSLKATHPSHLISGNFMGMEFPFLNDPTYTQTRFIQKKMNYLSTNSETESTVGTGGTLLSHPFGASSPISRSQYVYTASELNGGGIQGGPITGIKLDIDKDNNDIDFLKIKLKAVNYDEIDISNPDLDGFTEVYFSNTELQTSSNFFRFYENFNWNGTLNILIDISYSNTDEGTDNVVTGTNSGGFKGIVSAGKNAHLTVAGNEEIELPTEGFESINQEITISLWAYGDEEILPTNTHIFSGVNDQNQRNANAHLPWSNSQIYWDCGYANGAYDRINKTANLSDFEGKWSHWAFTKNATNGTMKIYLNGNEWHSGSGLTRPITITDFKIAPQYFGSIDEVRIWNKALTSQEISDWMFRNVDMSHPRSSNLIAYYKFNEGGGLSTLNSATFGGEIELSQEGLWNKNRAENINTGFDLALARPNMTFVSGDYSTDIEEVEVIVTEENPPAKIEEFQVTGTDLEEVSTVFLWEAKDELLLDESGNIISSTPTTPDGVISITELNYYRKLHSQFELMSFVTPYGIYLDLGPEGKTWKFDMTDFAPILNGTKRIFLGMGGQNQEEMDIKFHFKKGTPPRDVRNIQQIWRSGSSRNYQAIQADNYFEPVVHTVDPQGEAFKIRTMITGHGQEGEFIPRNHELYINGNKEFFWSIWTECADNPVYPQGGTWIYDRAGWCPGAPTDLQEWNITDMIVDGQVEIDYNVQSGSGDSRYIVNHQLVTYGPMNFQTDARITRILQPTNDVEFERENPVCKNPILILQNTGANTITSVEINYEVEGGEIRTHLWEGTLESMESEEVVLPVTDLGFWIGDGTNTFKATIESVNGAPDDNLDNNITSTKFSIPDMYDIDKMIIFLGTNNSGHETSYTVKDAEGNILISRENLSSTSLYADTLHLENGCYTI